MLGDCLGQNPECNLSDSARCSVTHHLAYPKEYYTTELEQAYRNLACNLVQRCVCLERADPHIPPRKPTPLEMIVAIRLEHDGKRPGA